ncbi:MAG: thioredoxin family protein [Verrucomicrobia bacterium]|nr:thioredoxin family protein [Verrucomicrobiota bacterium]
MRQCRVGMLLGLLAVTAFAAAPEYRSMGPDIFDPKVSGETLVADALRLAKRKDKKVLLLFGANWCPWCRRLHRALTTGTAVPDRLRKSFVLVFVDANTRNDKNRNAGLIEKYGNPLQFGLPVFVVLDGDGKQLTTRETASLAADTDAKVADNVLAFLHEWAK